MALAVLSSACSFFQHAEEARSIRPGSARDPAGLTAGAGAEQAPAVSLADLACWTKEEGSFVEDGDSAGLIAFRRDDVQSKDRRGLHAVLIGQTTVKRPIAPLAVDANLVGFQEAFLSETSSIIDRRSMAWVNGPDIGRRSKWSSIEFNSVDGVPTKVYSVVFMQDRSLAIVATVATQGAARLADTASLARDVSERLAGQDTVNFPCTKYGV